MKKAMHSLIITTLIFSLAGCSNSNNIYRPVTSEDLEQQEVSTSTSTIASTSTSSQSESIKSDNESNAMISAEEFIFFIKSDIYGFLSDDSLKSSELQPKVVNYLNSNIEYMSSLFLTSGNIIYTGEGGDYVSETFIIDDGTIDTKRVSAQLDVYWTTKKLKPNESLLIVVGVYTNSLKPKLVIFIEGTDYSD